MTLPALEAVNRAPEPSPNCLAILIDHDNCEELRDLVEPEPYRYFLQNVIRLAIAAAASPPEWVVIRTYGGWYQNGELSQRGSMVSAVMASVDPFPILLAGRVISGRAELAIAPYSLPAMVLPNTLRRRGASPRLRRNTELAHPSCTMNVECGARIVARWTKSPSKTCFVTDCVVPNRDAFSTTEQKMVDTMLSVDLMDMTTRPSFRSIAVVSDDTDFVPPLAYCGSLGATNIVVLPGIEWDAGIVELLEQHAVSLIGRSS